jgi:two-component system chemotaxis response regulator CheY
MSAKRVLSIGQCGADHYSISTMLQRHFGAEVVAAHDADEARTLLRDDSYALVLVNRILDADGSSGIDLIGQLKADKDLGPVPVMLVSNHDDAQQQAVGKGALRGFGKSSLGHPRTLDRLRAILG